ncbi:MAG: PrgI family mobile element protein [Desulfotomaculales bacterium]
MRAWPVPPEIENAQEKFLGPLGLRQFLYAVAGFVLGCLLAAVPLPLALRFCGFSLGLAAGAVLALARPCGMDGDVFLWRLWKWRRSCREFCLKGGE